MIRTINNADDLILILIPGYIYACLYSFCFSFLSVFSLLINNNNNKDNRDDNNNNKKEV